MPATRQMDTGARTCISSEGLELLLEALSSEGCKATVRERVDAHRLRDAFENSEEIDMEAALASLLVKDRQQRELLSRLYDRYSPKTSEPLAVSPASPPHAPHEQPRWRLVLAVTMSLLVLAAVTLFIIYVWSPNGIVSPPNQERATPQAQPIHNDTQPVGQPTPNRDATPNENAVENLRPTRYVPVVIIPDWLTYLITAIPLVIVVRILFDTGRNQRAYLLARLPKSPPILSELHFESPQRLTGSYANLHRIAQGLQVRTTKELERLDADATAVATARAGGLFTPVRKRSSEPPDYLILIEARGLDDLDAARLTALANRLHYLGVALDIFYFIGDPRYCYDDMSKTPKSIDRLAALYGRRRLIVMGGADRFLDPFTYKPQPWTQALKQWEHRAWLTPTPLDDWGRHEFEVADQLKMPVGRATEEGLAALAELLGLDERVEPPLYRVHETVGSHVRALPELLRREASRYLSSTPVSDDAWATISEQLELYLGSGGYRWLSVIAIWPQVQWDMTLFLGVGLHDGTGAPLYSEGRVAALTQLPWLRAGQMPRWLRTRLIDELPADARADAVSLIWMLIEGKIEERKGPDIVTWRLGMEGRRTRGAESHSVPHLLRETLFVDTLARERIPDRQIGVPVPERARDGLLAPFLPTISWPSSTEVFSIGLGLLLSASMILLIANATLPAKPTLQILATMAIVAFALQYISLAAGLSKLRSALAESWLATREFTISARAALGRIGATHRSYSRMPVMPDSVESALTESRLLDAERAKAVVNAIDTGFRQDFEHLRPADHAAQLGPEAGALRRIIESPRVMQLIAQRMGAGRGPSPAESLQRVVFGFGMMSLQISLAIGLLFIAGNLGLEEAAAGIVRLAIWVGLVAALLTSTYKVGAEVIAFLGSPRQNAKTLRHQLFNAIMRSTEVTNQNEISAPLLQLEYFIRFQLNAQISYLSVRLRAEGPRRALGRRTSFWLRSGGVLFVLLWVAMSMYYITIASEQGRFQKFEEFTALLIRFQASGAFGWFVALLACAAAFLLLASTFQLADRRVRYDVALPMLMALSGDMVERAREAAAKGDRSVMIDLMERTHKVLNKPGT